MEINSELLEIITVFATNIFVGMVSAFLGHKRASYDRTTQFHKDQLNKLYEPIMECLFLNEGVIAKDKVGRISMLMSKHNAYVPPKLAQEWIKQKKCSNPDWSVFLRILNSNYEWTRKQLGYPCDASQIHLKDIPERQSGIGWYIFGIVISAVALIGSVYGVSHTEMLLVKTELLLILVVSFVSGYFCVRQMFIESSKV